MELEYMKDRYLCLSVQASGQAGSKFGEGKRLGFLESCDGKTVYLLTSTGVRHKLRREEVRIVEVINRSGKVVPHSYRAEDGHLLVQQSDGTKVDFGPWQQYERAAAARKRTRARQAPTGADIFGR